MNVTETGLRIDLPPGFAGMPVTNDDETNTRIAWAVGEKVAARAGKTTEEFSGYLLAMAPIMKNNGIRLFGKFAVCEGPDYVATLTMGVARWPDGDPEMLAASRSAVAGALLDVYRQKHPRADARPVLLPIGPAMAAIEAGEFRLPPEVTGQASELVRPRLKAEYQIPLPSGEGVVILTVTAESETGWPSIARATTLVACSLRQASSDDEQA